MIEAFNYFYIFVLAGFVGYEVISRVPVILHTPLMSGSNFVHGIVVVGAYIEGARLRDPRRGPAPMTCRALPGLPTRPAGLSVRPAMKIRFPLLALNIAGGAAVLAAAQLRLWRPLRAAREARRDDPMP